MIVLQVASGIYLLLLAVICLTGLFLDEPVVTIRYPALILVPISVAVCVGTTLVYAF